jgi:hypothetical protein
VTAPPGTLADNMPVTIQTAGADRPEPRR